MNTKTIFLWTVFLSMGGLVYPALAGSESDVTGKNITISEAGESQRQSRPLAIVRRFSPVVVVRHIDNDQWINAEKTHALRDADTLRTGHEGFAVVQFMDNSVARVRPNSMLIVNGEVRAPGNIYSRLSVEAGDMFLNITGVNSTYEVATPGAVASVRGTAFTTLVDENGESVFTGFSGEVEVMALSSERVVTLNRGIRATIDANGEDIILTEVSEDELNRQFAYYDELDSDQEIKIMRLRFVNEEGEEEIIELEYYEVDSDNE